MNHSAATMPDNLLTAKKHLQQALRMIASPSSQTSTGKEVWVNMANEKIMQARKVLGGSFSSSINGHNQKTLNETILRWFEPHEQQMLKTGQINWNTHSCYFSDEKDSKISTNQTNQTNSTNPTHAVESIEYLKQKNDLLQQKLHFLQQEHNSCPLKEYVTQCETKIRELQVSREKDQELMAKQQDQLNKFQKTLQWTQRELNQVTEQLLQHRKLTHQDRRTTLSAQLTELEIEQLSGANHSHIDSTTHG